MQKLFSARAAAFKAKVPNVHAGEGRIEHVATVDTPDGHSIQTQFGEDTLRAWLPRPTTKVGLERHVVEKWASLAHLKAHGAASHMAACAAKMKDLIANRVIHVLSPA